LIVSDRNHKSVFVALVASTINPVEFPLANGGDAFWLDSRTIGYVAADEETKTVGLYSLSVHFTNVNLEVATSGPPSLMGKFPTVSPSSFRYTAKAVVLVFSDNVYEYGGLIKVPDNDEKWQDRGDTALVYDDTYERHWDHGRGRSGPRFSPSSSSRMPRIVGGLGTGSTMCGMVPYVRGLLSSFSCTFDARSVYTSLSL
jgi:hypothetical protein